MWIVGVRVLAGRTVPTGFGRRALFFTLIGLRRVGVHGREPPAGRAPDIARDGDLSIWRPGGAVLPMAVTNRPCGCLRPLLEFADT
jgi:hypothetical protein